MGMNAIHPVLVVKGALASSIGFNVVVKAARPRIRSSDVEEVLGPVMGCHDPMRNRLKERPEEGIHNPVGGNDVGVNRRVRVLGIQ
jgi:hypothetical protein